LVAARISAASASVIQSVAAGIDQSAVFEAAAVDDFSAGLGDLASFPGDPSDAGGSFLVDADESPSPDTAVSLFDPSSDPGASPSVPALAAPDPTVARRSFFAQPEPL
jgi:hypothetical protein